jgi:hypothetical protein
MNGTSGNVKQTKAVQSISPEPLSITRAFRNEKSVQQSNEKSDYLGDAANFKRC